MRSGALLLAFALLLVAAVSRAQPRGVSEKEVAEAKAHFEQGKAFYRSGVYDRAIEEYEAAYRLVPLPELLFNLGQAFWLKGDKKRAVEHYERFLERQPQGPLSDETREKIVNLTREIEREQAETKAREKAMEPPPAKPAETLPPKPVPDESSGRALRISGLVTGVAGLAMLGLAVKYGFDAGSASDDLAAIDARAAQSGNWSGLASEANRVMNEGESAQRSMYICYGIGGALVATGTVLYLLGRRSAPEEVRSALRWEPQVTPLQLALSLRGAF